MGAELVSLTSEAHEEAEEHRIEEAEADCKNVLMDHGRYRKHRQHGHCSETFPRHLGEEKTDIH